MTPSPARFLGLLALVAPLSLARAQESGPSSEATVGERYAPGEEALWIFEQDGKEIGRSWSRYQGVVDRAGRPAHAFRSCTRLATGQAGPAAEQLLTTDLWTDEHGHPLFVDFRLALADVRAGVELTPEGERTHAVILQGPARREQDLPFPANGFVLANNFLSHLELCLSLHSVPAEEPLALELFSVNALKAFPFKVELVEQRPAAEGEPALAVLKDSLGEILQVDERGKLLRVEIAAAKLVMRRADGPFEPFVVTLPPRRKAPEDLAVEPVRIDYDDVSLAGNLTHRKGLEGPFPAVFFISGSGSQDRDGFAGGIDVGTHEILDRLARAGYLVLAVDDRGAGESTGPTEGATYDDLVEDARRCARFLLARPEVDPRRVALIGHSEGGMTAPLLAAEMPELAAIVLLAAPGRGILPITREQLLAGRQRQGASEEELAELGRKVDEFYAALAEGKEPEREGMPPELGLLLGAKAWMVSHLKQDPLAAIRRVRCPVLLMQGARDIQVSVERDARPLVQALDECGHADHELVVLPELDHLFKYAAEGSAGLEYLEDRRVDEGFLDALVAWLDAHLK